MTWTRQTVRTALVALFAEHTQPGTDITETSHLVADLGIDSLGVMEIMEAIEDRYALKIPDEALREVETVADVAVAIEKRLEAEGRLSG
jgi:acyl carrier protein